MRRKTIEVRGLAVSRLEQNVGTGILSLFDVTGQQRPRITVFRLGTPSDDRAALAGDLRNVARDMRRAVQRYAN